jgi:hypothetical protein
MCYKDAAQSDDRTQDEYQEMPGSHVDRTLGAKVLCVCVRRCTWRCVCMSRWFCVLCMAAVAQILRTKLLSPLCAIRVSKTKLKTAFKKIYFGI